MISSYSSRFDLTLFGPATKSLIVFSSSLISGLLVVAPKEGRVCCGGAPVSSSMMPVPEQVRHGGGTALELSGDGCPTPLPLHTGHF